jgi:geranylgeranyl reductase family protein
MAEQWDVIVVGGGPAGATSAYLLARHGHRVLVVDRQHFPRPKACAEYMSPGVRVIVRRLGLEEAVMDGALTVPGMDILSPTGKVLRVAYSANGRAQTAVTLQRERLDGALLATAAFAGASIREGFVARAAHMEEGVVVGVRGTHNGQSVRLESRLTVVADGNRSVLARSLGLARTARWPKRMGLVAHMEGVELPDSFGQMHVAEEGYCGIAPLPGGMANVAVVVSAEAVKRSGLTATRFFDDWLLKHPSLHPVVHSARLLSSVRGVSPIGARARNSTVPGALLVGDAAGFFDPFTGEGIYRALRGAEMAAQVAHAALQTGDPHLRLGSYESMRQDSFRSKSAVTALVQLFVQRPALLEYAVPRLSSRSFPLATLGNVLGDIEDPRRFLHPQMLWSALRP